MSGIEVKVLRFQPVNKGSLLAFASVDIGGKMKIHSCRLIKDGSKAAWVSLPQSEWTDSEGKKKYFSIIELPENVKEAIQDAVLEAWAAREA